MHSCCVVSFPDPSHGDETSCCAVVLSDVTFEGLPEHGRLEMEPVSRYFLPSLLAYCTFFPFFFSYENSHVQYTLHKVYEINKIK